MIFTRNDTKIVKGFAIILMLYHHLFAFPNRLAVDVSYEALITHGELTSAMLLGLFGRVCVALFLFLGGYGTWLSFQAKRADADSSSFVLRKIKGLYVPYLQAFAVMIPIALLLSDQRVTPALTSLFWNASGLNITYNGEWWFFTDYLILLLAFPLMYWFTQRRRAAVSVDVLLTCVWVAAVTWFIPAIMQADTMQDFSKTLIWKKLYQTMQWSPCFLMGCIFARWDLLSRLKTKFSGSYVSCALLVATIVLLVPLRYKLSVGYRYDFLYAPVICVALAVATTTPLGRILAKPLEAIGNRSTFIWLTHSFYCYHWCQEFIFAPHYSVLIFLLLLAISYLTALLIEWLFRKIGVAWAWAQGKLTYIPRTE